MAVRKKSTLKHLINQGSVQKKKILVLGKINLMFFYRIMKLKEMGLINHFIKEKIIRPLELKYAKRVPVKEVKILFENIVGIFLLLLIGMSLSIFILTIEKALDKLLIIKRGRKEKCLKMHQFVHIKLMLIEKKL